MRCPALFFSARLKGDIQHSPTKTTHTLPTPWEDFIPALDLSGMTSQEVVKNHQFKARDCGFAWIQQ
jgi:hypothetical protein